MNVILQAQQFHKPETFITYIFNEKPYSNFETSSKAKRFAQGLVKLGHIPGDIVATILPNCAEIPPIYEGILRRAGVVLPVIFALTAPEIAYILRDSHAKFIVTNGSVLEKVIEAMIECPQRFTVIVVDGKGINDFIDYETLLRDCSEDEEIVERGKDDLAVVIYTSGTTGNPKGVMLTHGNIDLNRPEFYNFLFPPGSCILATLPLNHAFGLLLWVTTYLKHGATLILHEWFDAVKVLQDIQKYRIAICPMVPTMLQMIMAQKDLSSYDTSSVRFWLAGAAPLPPDRIHEIEERLGGKVINDYGLSEAWAVACQDPNGVRKPGSAGRVFREMEVKIVGTEGIVLQPGEWGEICIKGPTVMKGYLNRPEVTAKVIKDGWLHSGDIGYFDEEGHLFVTDRIKDMIIRGGTNIYSVEVENALFKHPAVSEACVIGIPDPIYGEEVSAVVVLHPGQKATEEEILTAAKKLIPRYKCPKKIEFWSELPKTRTGKVFKPAVRERALEKDAHDK